MTRRLHPLRLVSLAPALALGALLCSCSAGGSITLAPATISSAEFGTNVSTQLQKQTGLTPIVDCGTADIPLVDGSVVHCDVSSADDPTVHYDSSTTISSVNGGDFHIDIKVADTPKG